MHVGPLRKSIATVTGIYGEMKIASLEVKEVARGSRQDDDKYFSR